MSEEWKLAKLLHANGWFVYFRVVDEWTYLMARKGKKEQVINQVNTSVSNIFGGWMKRVRTDWIERL